MKKRAREFAGLTHPAPHRRVDGRDSGCFETRRRQPTFIWLDWTAPWLRLSAVTAEGKRSQEAGGRIMGGRGWATATDAVQEGSSWMDKTFIVPTRERLAATNARSQGDVLVVFARGV